jgi:hypothetical protein
VLVLALKKHIQPAEIARALVHSAPDAQLANLAEVAHERKRRADGGSVDLPTFARGDAPPTDTGDRSGPAIGDMRAPIDPSLPEPQDLPRSARNNNPGNLVNGDFARSQPGYAGDDGRFARFETPDQGQMATGALLDKYAQQGIDTPHGIISKFAPPNENDTRKYAMHVADTLGVSPHDRIDMSDPGIRAIVSHAIRHYEGGRQADRYYGNWNSAGNYQRGGYATDGSVGDTNPDNGFAKPPNYGHHDYVTPEQLSQSSQNENHEYRARLAEEHPATAPTPKPGLNVGPSVEETRTKSPAQLAELDSGSDAPPYSGFTDPLGRQQPETAKSDEINSTGVQSPVGNTIAPTDMGKRAFPSAADDGGGYEAPELPAIKVAGPKLSPSTRPTENNLPDYSNVDTEKVLASPPAPVAAAPQKSAPPPPPSAELPTFAQKETPELKVSAEAPAPAPVSARAPAPVQRQDQNQNPVEQFFGGVDKFGRQIGATITGGVNQLLNGSPKMISPAGQYNKQRLDPRLTDTLTQASKGLPEGYTAQLVSGYREGDPRLHGRGLATDIQIYDPQGRPVSNYQNANSFRLYEKFAHDARLAQQHLYPELSDNFRWGGYFSGGKEGTKGGRYGAADLMHFDLGGGWYGGMKGGSWEHGLTPAQRALFPGVESSGMGQQQQAQQQPKDNNFPLFSAEHGQAQPTYNAQAFQDPNAPRNVRLMNPGNVIESAFARRQVGYLGNDGKFARFDTPEHGLLAAENLLTTYAGQGRNTISSIMNKWSPGNENNTGALIKSMSERMGVGPNDPINMNDPAVRRQLALGFAEQEGGPKAKLAYAGSGDQGGGVVDAANRVINHVVGAGGNAVDQGLRTAHAILGGGGQPDQRQYQASAQPAQSGGGGGFNPAQAFADNRSWLIPLLSGIGTMASSNSPYLGTALLQGLGGGAQAWSKEQASEADLAGKQGQNRGTDIENAERLQGITKKGIIYDKSGNPIMAQLADGSMISWAQYLTMAEAGNPPALYGQSQLPGAISRTNQTAAPNNYSAGPSAPAGASGYRPPLPGGAGAGVSAPGQPTFFPASQESAPQTRTAAQTASGLGSAGNAALQQGYHNYMVNPQQYQEHVAESGKTETEVNGAGNAARQLRGSLLQQTDAILNQPDTGWAAGGPLNGVRTNVLSYANSLADTLGLPSNWRITPEDIANKTAIDKLHHIASMSAAHGYGQTSLGAAEMGELMNPGSNMSKASAVKVLAGLYSDSQRTLDLQNYIAEGRQQSAKRPGGTGNYLTQDLISAFNKDHDYTQYGTEKHVVEDFLSKRHAKTKKPLFSDVYARTVPAERVDSLTKTPGVNRYFTGQ